jgi:hypothetical protein
LRREDRVVATVVYIAVAAAAAVVDDVADDIHYELVALDCLDTAKMEILFLSEKVENYCLYLEVVQGEPQDVGDEVLIAVVVEEGNPFPVRCLFLSEVEEEAFAADHLYLRMDFSRACCSSPSLSHH